MGTWDAGPWDNDSAADWSARLDERTGGAKVDAIRAALTAAADEEGFLDSDVGCVAVAVAAASLVAAQCDGGEPVDTAYRPDQPVPELGPDLTALRALAVRALDRVTAEDSELAELWAEGNDAAWRASIVGLREVLEPSA